jgi:ribonucleoside-diphosphate reductase alpha subunit
MGTVVDPARPIACCRRPLPLVPNLLWMLVLQLLGGKGASVRARGLLLPEGTSRRRSAAASVRRWGLQCRGGDDPPSGAVASAVEGPASAAAATATCNSTATTSMAANDELEDRRGPADVQDAGRSSSTFASCDVGQSSEDDLHLHRQISSSPSPPDPLAVSPEGSTAPPPGELPAQQQRAVTRERLREMVRSVVLFSNDGNDDDDTDKSAQDLEFVLDRTMQGAVPAMSDAEICTLLSETSASLATHHPKFGQWAARIVLHHLRQVTPSTFVEAMTLIQETLHPDLHQFIQRNAQVLNAWTSCSSSNNNHNHRRTLELTYLGLCTLQRSYLLRSPATGQIVERPEYMYLRVALGIHLPKAAAMNDDDNAPAATRTVVNEEQVLQNAYETYQLLLNGTMTHASPTLFHAGTRHAQLSSCFLLQMTDDSIKGIYETLARCAVVSKGAGGIGLAVSKIRARGTRIAGTGGYSNGLVPMLRVYDATCRYVDQGGGKRPGAFAIYLEPWHADVYELLNLKKNHGKEEQRARDLFYGLWIPDLFMERVYQNQMWSLFCPHQCPGLHECHGQEFVDLYTSYEREGRYVRQVKARDLWTAILESQIETGTPYMCYKDACNAKSNQNHLGTISSSNLCTEIIQYTSPGEVAVCNLASLCLPRFVRTATNRNTDRDEPKDSTSEFGSPLVENDSEGDGEQRWFDHEALHRAVKVVTRNLNKIIDINQYPVPEAEVSNRLHRPIGIGVSGLADTFVRLGFAFGSEPAKHLNTAIFETMYHAALEASAELAEKDGWYASFPGSPASQGLLQHHLWGMSDDETPSKRSFGNSALPTAGLLRRGYSDVARRIRLGGFAPPDP